MEDKIILVGITATFVAPRFYCELVPEKGWSRIVLLALGTLQVMVGLFLCVALAHAGSTKLWPAVIVMCGMFNLWSAARLLERSALGQDEPRPLEPEAMLRGKLVDRSLIHRGSRVRYQVYTPDDDPIGLPNEVARGMVILGHFPANLNLKASGRDILNPRGTLYGRLVDDGERAANLA